MRLEAMAVKFPHVDGHPNRVSFEGVLTMVNAASDKAPAGARGHRVVLTREAAEAALPSLLGMAVDYKPGWDGHDARRKIGLLTEADVIGQRLMVSGASSAADGAHAAAAVTVLAGSTATSVALAAADAAKFLPGSIIAIDNDYIGQTGFVAAPISGAYVRQPLSDVDYIRRVTFNVALVYQVNSTALVLAEPLPGGAPSAGEKLQAVTGFVDREGGSFYQEWSALFVMQGSQGERIFFYYPRLQTSASAEELSTPLTSKASAARVGLRAQFLALPVTDPLDGERVLCYRSFVPAANALV